MAAAPPYVIGIKPLMARLKALIEGFQSMCLDQPSAAISRQRNTRSPRRHPAFVTAR